MKIVFTRKKSRVGANTESPLRNQSETNIHEVCSQICTVFTQEQTYLFVQRVAHFSQEKKGDDLHYHILCLNESSTEYGIKKPTVNCLFDFTQTKISIHRLLM